MLKYKDDVSITTLDERYVDKTNNKKYKILVILTGGTICSVYTGNIKSQGSKAGTILEENFVHSESKYANQVQFKTTENYQIFSENITINQWNFLTEKFRNIPEIRDTAIKKGAYPSLTGCSIESDENLVDGIIIAHGTDTLAYSSALFALLFKNIGVPVFVVSSNEALSSVRANGNLNFSTAVECICERIQPNIYVAYHNFSDNTMYLHLASRLTQCKNYQEDFYSEGMIPINQYYKEFNKLPSFESKYKLPNGDNRFCIDFFTDLKLSNSILRVDPYVGLNYNFFDFSLVKAILHGTYHSGTVCSVKTDRFPEYSCNSILYLFEICPELPIYIAPSCFDDGIYDTVLTVARNTKRTVQFVNGYTMEMLYVKLLIAISSNFSISEINDFLLTEYNKEFVIEVDSDTTIMHPYQKDES